MNTGNFLNTSHQMISWFDQENRQGHLELRPPFQRRPVWSDEEKAFLIDSILRGYPVPEIYVQSSTESDAAQYAVVDGQQRLRACLEFLIDRFPVSFDITKLHPLHDLQSTPWYGKRFSQLTPEEQQRFRRYKLIVRDLEEASDDEVRHLFYRLNQSNVSLNAQELRFSLYKDGILSVAESIVERPEWDHFRFFTKQQRRRMLDSEFISELVIGYLHWPQNKKDNLDSYYRQYASALPASSEILEVFNFTLETLKNIFPEPHFGGTRWYRKSDFYTLFLALARGVLSPDDDISKFKENLIQFSDRVSGPRIEDESDEVLMYREAVERASTDRGRRVRREEALVAFMHHHPISQEASRVEEDTSVDELAESDAEEASDEEYQDRLM